MSHFNENNKAEKLNNIYEENLDKIYEKNISIETICKELNHLSVDEIFNYLAGNKDDLLVALELSKYLSSYDEKEGSDKPYGKRKDSH